MSAGNDESRPRQDGQLSNRVQNLNHRQGTTPDRQVPAAALDGCVIPPPIGCDEAERGVLGGLLCLPALEARAVTDHLQPADFTDPRHAAIFGAVVDLTSDGVPADPITLVDHLRRTGRERCFTTDRDAGVYLADLLDALPSVGNLGHYARVVIEHSARRRAVEATWRIGQVAELSDLATARQVTLDELQAVFEGFDRIGATS
jgi:replicative DNA helicase